MFTKCGDFLLGDRSNNWSVKMWRGRELGTQCLAGSLYVPWLTSDLVTDWTDAGGCRGC